MIVNGYKTMWLIVMFDLPTNTNKEKRDYTLFRKTLLKDGFTMLQFSVYARSCPTEENAEVHYFRIKHSLPPEGQVRILTLTDKQYGRQKMFLGKKSKPVEESPKQLEIF